MLHLLKKFVHFKVTSVVNYKVSSFTFPVVNNVSILKTTFESLPSSLNANASKELFREGLSKGALSGDHCSICNFEQN